MKLNEISSESLAQLSSEQLTNLYQSLEDLWVSNIRLDEMLNYGMQVLEEIEIRGMNVIEEKSFYQRLT